jgi:hypothetical protein
MLRSLFETRLKRGEINGTEVGHLKEKKDF